MKKWVLFIFGGAFVVFLFFYLKLAFQNSISLNPIAFQVGPFSIHWYGIIIAGGIILCYFICRNIGMSEGMNDEHIAEGIIVSIFTGIIGARTYYVLSQWPMYKNNLVTVFMTWQGGLAIYGGVIGGIVGLYLYTKIRKNCSFGFLQALDLGAALVPLGQAIGRWGNFFNYEAYGKPTNLPWKMFIPYQYRMDGFQTEEFFHPTFLYESMWDFLTFAILMYYYRNKRKNIGEATSLYFIVYSFGRFFIESLRLDSLYWGNQRAAQVTSSFLFVLGIGMFIYFKKAGKPAIKPAIKNG